MKSMTGYGRGESVQGGYKVVTEVSSVNRRQSEISIYLPRDLESLESRIRSEANRRMARGRIIIRVSLHTAEGDVSGRVELNASLAKAYALAFQKLAREIQIDDRVTLDQLIRSPGVFRAEGEIADAEGFWPSVEKALKQALSGVVQMRATEGAHLLADLEARVATMRLLTNRIRKLAPRTVETYRRQLRNRIKQAGLEPLGLDDDRLLKEVVYFADRSDISEELTRLESHFKQFAGYAKAREPVGRTLDFLAQEINREVNTIGSKASDSQISRNVVKLKAELEKFREQVQNVE